MFTKTFFKLFPPPKFLDEPYAGVDISDTAVRCIQFAQGKGRLGKNGGLVIAKYGMQPLVPGVVEGGFVKEKEKLTAAVTELATKLRLDRVRASLPEEEMYIFKTKVPISADRKTKAQNIEFKLEENVPLSPANAIFHFETIPGTENAADGTISASVTVAPRKMVETYLDIFKGAGLTVISFEIQARALARAFIEKKDGRKAENTQSGCKTMLIVQIMERKIGMYVIYDSVVCFTSTVPRGENLAESINVESQKIRDYWAERGEGKKEIDCICISGKDALTSDLTEQISHSPMEQAEVTNVWRNAFSTEDFISPIPADESLDYAVAVGLALPE